MVPVNNSASASDYMSAIPAGMSKATFDAYINDKVTKFIESHSIDMRILNESLNSRVMTKPINHENVSYLSNNQNLPIKSNDGEVIYASVEIAKPEKQQKPVKVQNEETLHSDIKFTKKAVNLGDEKKSIQGANGFGQVGVNGSEVTYTTIKNANANTLDTVGEEEPIFVTHNSLFGVDSPYHINNIAQDEPIFVTHNSLYGVDSPYHINNIAQNEPIHVTSQSMASEKTPWTPDKPLPEMPRSFVGKFFDSIANTFARFFETKSN